MHSNGPTRREHHAEDTRRALLAAARHAFARNGYADTPLEEIVAAARLTKGALYHHFANKAALLEALYTEMEAEVAGRVRAAVEACRGDAWARMLAALDAFLAASAEPTYARIVLRDAPLVLGHRGRQIDQAIGLGLIAELFSALRADGMSRTLSSSLTARVVLASISEVATAMAHASDPAALRREGTAVIVALLEGLRGPLAVPRAAGRSQRARARRA